MTNIMGLIQRCPSVFSNGRAMLHLSLLNPKQKLNIVLPFVQDLVSCPCTTRIATECTYVSIAKSLSFCRTVIVGIFLQLMILWIQPNISNIMLSNLITYLFPVNNFPSSISQHYKETHQYKCLWCSLHCFSKTTTPI